MFAQNNEKGRGRRAVVSFRFPSQVEDPSATVYALKQEFQKFAFQNDLTDSDWVIEGEEENPSFSPLAGTTAVGYIRCSTSGDDGARSVEIQKERIRRWAEEHGVTIVEWYVDKGNPGRSLERPALRDLTREAFSGEHRFDLVLIGSYARLSRNRHDSSVMVSLLRACRVRVVSCSEGPARRFPKENLTGGIL